jgi:hypothetical protein
MAEKKNVINPKLEKALGKLLDEVMKPAAEGKEAASITEKMKVIDRVLKLEAIKHKMKDDGYGTGFFNGDADDKGG